MAALLQRLTANQIKLMADRASGALAVEHSAPDELATELARERANAIPSHADISPIESRELIAKADPVALAGLLDNELPQTVATVLNQLPAARASAVLGRLGTELQLAVTQRLASCHDPLPEVLLDVCSAIANRTQAQGTRPLGSRGGPVMIARMLERMDGPTRRALIENLAQQDPILLERVGDVQRLLRACRLARFVERRPESQAA